MEKRVKLNEAQLHELVKGIVKESIKRIIKESNMDEVNNVTAYNAYAKAKQQYDDLVAKGQGNSAQAMKLKRQMNTFYNYSDFGGNFNPQSEEELDAALAQKNQYGNTVGKFISDWGKAYGQPFNTRQVAKGWVGQDGADFAKDDEFAKQQAAAYDERTGSTNWTNPKTAEQMGLRYNKGKKGFLGIGKKSGGWSYDPQLHQQQQQQMQQQQQPAQARQMAENLKRTGKRTKKQ